MLWLNSIFFPLAITLSLALFPIQVQANKVLVIGSMEHFPPYNYMDEDGKQIGIDAKIIELIFSDLKIEYQHQPRPWARAIAEFEEGETDALFQLVNTPERDAKWLMVGPLRPNRRAYFVHQNSPIKNITSISQLKGLKVGTIRGFTYAEAFTNATHFTKHPVTSIRQNILKLDAKRIDIVIESDLAFLYELRQTELASNIRMLPTCASAAGRYMAFQRNAKGHDLAKRFQDKLNELRKTNIFETIIDSCDFP